MKFQPGDIVYVPFVIKETYEAITDYDVALLGAEKHGSIIGNCGKPIDRYGVKAELVAPELPKIEATHE